MGVILHYSVYMRTSGEKVRISDEVERVQSVSYFHIRSLSGLYRVVCLKEGKRGTYLGSRFATVMCKVACLTFKWAQQQLQCISGLLSLQRAPSCNVKIPCFQRGPK